MKSISRERFSHKFNFYEVCRLKRALNFDLSKSKNENLHDF